MKHNFTKFLCGLFTLCSVSAYSQVNTYTFSQSAGAYTPITGGTVLGVATNDDTSFPNQAIGFTFNYNNVNYTAFSVNSNGFIALGTTVTSSYTAISTGATNNIIAGLNRDLQGNSTGGNLRYQTIGTAPNRTLVVQWTSYMSWPSNNAEQYNFQIRLNETSNVVEVVYGSFTCTTTRTVQVGLRGSTNADFNNRTTTTNWAATTPGGLNSSTCTLSPTVFPVTGQTFVWTPPPPTPMAYVSSTCTQTVTTNVTRGSINNQIIGIQIVTSGQLSPFDATSFTLNSTGTTNFATDVTNVRIWYTGTSPTFATTTQFGPTVTSLASPITGTQTLQTGTNYFWVTYDINATATIGNFVDAQCTQIVMSGAGGTQVPTVTAPTGNRQINYCTPIHTIACSSGDYINNFSTTGGLTNITNNNSGCNGQPNNYIYYNTMTVSGYQGNSFNVSMQSGPFGQGFRIWIDWNQDGDFADPGEDVYNSGTSGTGVFNGTVAIPGTATLGTTRMRVRCAWATVPTTTAYCSTLSYGEVEDYNVNVQPVPPIDMSVTGFVSPLATAGCLSGNQTVSVTIRNNGSALMDYSVTPVTVNASVTGPNPATFTPVVLNSGTLAVNATQTVVITTTYDMTLSGTYSFTASTSVTGDGNTSNDSFGPYIVVNTPLTVSAGSDPAPFCPGGSAQLSACSPLMATIGTGNVQNTTTTYPAPYGNWYWGSRHQFLILASELTAQGIGAGNINSLAFDVVSNTGAALDNFTISMGMTGLNSITSFQTGTTQVFTTASYLPVPGWNTHVFTTPFNWDGVSNVIVEVCHNNTSYTVNAVTRMSNTTFNSTVYYFEDNFGVCANNTVFGNPLQRPNMQIGACISGPYTWTPTTGLSNPNISNPVASPTTTTSYMVMLSNTTGCTATDTVVVTVDPVPVVALGNDTTLCQGDSILLDAGNPGSTYSWNNGATTQTITTDTAANYIVVVTNVQGCVNSDTVLVLVNPRPIVNIGNDTTFCQGGMVVYDAGNPGDTYLWNTSATTQTITATTSGSYDVIVTNSFGCSGRDTAIVTVNPLPVVALGPDQVVCDSVMLDAQNPGDTYMWNTGATTQTIMVNNTGSYFVVVTNGNSCSNSDTISVTVNPSPIVSLGADTAFCQNDSVMLDAGNPGSTYLWSDASTNQTLTVGTAGTYYVLVTNSFGCTKTDSITIAINALPVVALGNDTTLCGGPLVLDAGNPGASYLWDNAATTQTVLASTTGTYSVIVTDNNGCSNNDSISVTINANPVATLGSDSAVCGTTHVLDAGNPGSTYMWSTSATTQTITINTSGTYFVTVTTPQGCTVSDTVAIILNTPPTANAGSDTSICVGNSVTLDGGSGWSGYLWEFSNFSATTQMITVTPGQTTTYTLTVTDTNGCTGTDLVIVTVDQAPVASFTYVITGGNTVTFTNTSTGSSPLTFTWNFGDGSPTSNLANPVHTYTANGTYTVILIASNACGSFTFSQQVTITGIGYEELSAEGLIRVFPNPSNGLFTISVDMDLDQLQVDIFDLTGKQVFSSMDEYVTQGFNKQIDLQELADGMYTIRINTGNMLKTGRLIISK